jgi:hypothetical protein
MGGVAGEDFITFIFLACLSFLPCRPIRDLALLLYGVSKHLIDLVEVFLIWWISRLSTNSKRSRQTFTQSITFERVPDFGIFINQH